MADCFELPCYKFNVACKLTDSQIPWPIHTEFILYYFYKDFHLMHINNILQITKMQL